jgi:transposase InsO family protein
MRYAFIEAQRTQHSVNRMCRLLEVSRAGYYEWSGRPKSNRAVANEQLREQIVVAHVASHCRYGRPRIHAELQRKGVKAGINRIGRVMKSAGIAGISPRPFRKTTDSNHDLPIAPNLVERRFAVNEIDGVNRVWVGDITYLPTREGWLYLAIVVDLASRCCVGWSMDSTMERSLVIDALQAAIDKRKPEAGLIFHSDRGSQYASNDYREILEAHKILASMSRKGDCWDNACAESFFGSMKRELGNPIWETREAARAAVFSYIEVWYNRVRRHSSLGYTSPEEFESSLPIAA